MGEGADDAGGVFDDTMTEMCHELVTGAVPLLISTPNAVSDVGNNRDRFLLNPDLTQANHLMWFKFLGGWMSDLVWMWVTVVLFVIRL